MTDIGNVFDDIANLIQEKEDNAIAKAFTAYIGDCLRREGIVPIMTKVEMPYAECFSKDEYTIISRYGYTFERLDTSEHDKQIRDEVIDRLKKLLQIEYKKRNIDYSEMCVLDKVIRQLRGE